MPGLVTPRSAATVVVLREPESGAGPFELLLLRRGASLAFLGGSYVFPGGVVDDGDRSERIAALADGRANVSRFPHVDAVTELELRVAAVRELLEEASVLLARGNDGWAGNAEARDVRKGLAGGATFADALAGAGLRLALDALVPFAHFVTPRTEPRRFDTCFFLTVLPPGQHADPVAGESDDHSWVSPARAVEAGTTGGLRVPAPTLIAMAQLAEHASVASALAWARDRAIPFVEPRLEIVGASRIVTVPDETLLPRHHPWWQPGGLRFAATEDRGWRPEQPAARTGGDKPARTH